MPNGLNDKFYEWLRLDGYTIDPDEHDRILIEELEVVHRDDEWIEMMIWGLLYADDVPEEFEDDEDDDEDFLGVAGQRWSGAGWYQDPHVPVDIAKSWDTVHNADLLRYAHDWRINEDDE